MSLLIYPTPKLAPIQGLAGMGGGATGLGYAGGAVAEPFAENLYIAFPFWNGGSGSSMVMNNNYGTSTQTTSFAQRGSANVDFNTSNHTTSEGGDSYGGSAYFDKDASGSDNASVLVANANDSGLRFHGDDPFSVMVDMKWADGADGQMRIWFGGNNGWLDADGWWYYINNSHFGIAKANHTGNPSYYTATVAGDVLDGNWHQHAMCYNGNGTAYFYVDGAKEGTATSISTGTWAGYNHSGVDGGQGDTKLTINGFPYPAAPGSSDIIHYAEAEMYINDLRIYNVDISSGGASTIDVRKSLLRIEGVV